MSGWVNGKCIARTAAAACLLAPEKAEISALRLSVRRCAILVIPPLHMMALIIFFWRWGGGSRIYPRIPHFVLFFLVLASLQLSAFFSLSIHLLFAFHLELRDVILILVFALGAANRRRAHSCALVPAERCYLAIRVTSQTRRGAVGGFGCGKLHAAVE